MVEVANLVLVTYMATPEVKRTVLMTSKEFDDYRDNLCPGGGIDDTSISASQAVVCDGATTAAIEELNQLPGNIRCK